MQTDACIGSAKGRFVHLYTRTYHELPGRIPWVEAAASHGYTGLAPHGHGVCAGHGVFYSNSMNNDFRSSD
jgi:hypothetical protein